MICKGQVSACRNQWSGKLKSNSYVVESKRSKRRGVCKKPGTHSEHPGTPWNTPEHPRNTPEHPGTPPEHHRNSPEQPWNTPGTSHNTHEHPIMPRNTLNTARNTLEYQKFRSAVRPLTHSLTRGPPRINEDFRIFPKTFADHPKTK